MAPLSISPQWVNHIKGALLPSPVQFYEQNVDIYIMFMISLCMHEHYRVDTQLVPSGTCLCKKVWFEIEIIFSNYARASFQLQYGIKISKILISVLFIASGLWFTCQCLKILISGESFMFECVKSTYFIAYIKPFDGNLQGILITTHM